jgi:hypothetical protein
MRTSRRRVDGVLCHGTSITLRLGFRLGSAPFGLTSSMTNWSDLDLDPDDVIVERTASSIAVDSLR